ncbi:MAG: polyprenyl synthetase family protein, partial [Chloroflexota bacterium]
MLRSALCLAMCEALGDDLQACLPTAVSVEFIHRTSLVSDDIQDRSPIRNGRPTVQARWGDGQAVNAGLALSSYSRLSLVGSKVADRARIQGHLEQAVLDLCQGQHMDLAFRDSPPTPQQYTEMVLRKTGILLGAACKVGAIVADQPDAVWARAALFGEPWAWPSFARTTTWECGETGRCWGRSRTTWRSGGAASPWFSPQRRTPR